jgi:hypothetical protein
MAGGKPPAIFAKGKHMTNSKNRALRCRISAGAFSGERHFRLVLADGSEHFSLAPKQHFWKADGSQLGEEEPSGAVEIDGIIAARIIQSENSGRVLVSIPDDETVIVNTVQVIKRPAEIDADVAGSRI